MDNPKLDPRFKPSIDNLTPVLGIKNITIMRMVTDDGKIIGILQIVNKGSLMDAADYLTMVKIISGICGNLFEVIKGYIDERETINKLKGGFDKIKLLLGGAFG